MKLLRISTFCAALVLMFAAVHTVSAQKIASAKGSGTSAYEMGIRYLKLGNSYREARDVNNAMYYIQRGYDLVANRASRYWEAVANEYMGLVYRDMGDRLTALEYLRRAEQIYRQIIRSRNADWSDTAIQMLINDVEYGMTAANYSAPYYYTSPDAERLRVENQRLQEANRQLASRIESLESRIRLLEYAPGR
jgi:tetratricopeptide (TPR) repeat protein